MRILIHKFLFIFLIQIIKKVYDIYIKIILGFSKNLTNTKGSEGFERTTSELHTVSIQLKNF